MIKTAASPVRCNDVAPPPPSPIPTRGKGYPYLHDCGEPAQLPVGYVDILGIRLVICIYSKEQMVELIRFKDSQITRRAFLAESVERAYIGHRGGKLGLGLSDLATDQIVDGVGNKLVPPYRILRPTPFVVLMMLFLI